MNFNVAYFNFETKPKLNETFEGNIGPDYLIPILSHIVRIYGLSFIHGYGIIEKV